MRTDTSRSSPARDENAPALAPRANTAMRTTLPVPLGRLTTPRTLWLGLRGSTPSCTAISIVCFRGASRSVSRRNKERGKETGVTATAYLVKVPPRILLALGDGRLDVELRLRQARVARLEGEREGRALRRLARVHSGRRADPARGRARGLRLRLGGRARRHQQRLHAHEGRSVAADSVQVDRSPQ